MSSVSGNGKIAIKSWKVKKSNRRLLQKAQKNNDTGPALHRALCDGNRSIHCIPFNQTTDTDVSIPIPGKSENSALCPLSDREDDVMGKAFNEISPEYIRTAVMCEVVSNENSDDSVSTSERDDLFLAMSRQMERIEMKLSNIAGLISSILQSRGDYFDVDDIAYLHPLATGGL